MAVINMLYRITEEVFKKLPKKKIVSSGEGISNKERLFLALGAKVFFGKQM